MNDPITESMEKTVSIPSEMATEIEDGKLIAKNVEEYSTEKIYRIHGEFFYIHENGGHRGAHDRMCGDGVWRERPVEPAIQIGRGETIAKMLTWGYAPAKIAELTRQKLSVNFKTLQDLRPGQTNQEKGKVND